MSTFLLMLRLLLALAFVGGLLWFMGRAAKSGKFGAFLSGGPTHNDLEVTSQRPLGRNASIALVRAGERQLLLGVSEHGVQLLAEGNDLTSPISEEVSVGAGHIEDSHIDLADLTQQSTTQQSTTQQTTERQAAPKHLSAMFSQTQPRMTLIESLRELTVRKS